MCGFLDDDNTKGIDVRHGDEGSTGVYGTLAQFAGDIVESSEWRNRVVFVLLDIKTANIPLAARCRWGAHGENRRGNYDIIADRLETALGAGRIYRQSDWEAEGKVWPSVEDLVRRGKHFICIYDNNEGFNNSNDGGNLNHDLLFVTAQDTGHLESWTGFVNTKDNDNGDFNVFQRPPFSPYLWRSYDLNEEAEFGAGVSSGRQLLATDE